MLEPRLFEIATSRSRRNAAGWQNTETTWADFITRIRETHRTHETSAEYRQMKKSEQANIKDVGGFVAGFLAGGRRSNKAVTSRSMLTLDLDFADLDFWEDFTLAYGCAAAVYSTHKHSARKGGARFRLIVPLARDVSPEEYEAVARKLAGANDIDVFDDTTFQPARMMFWPSTSKDAPYFFESQDGELLDPDALLGQYRDWKDSSAWPFSSRATREVRRTVEKAGDPHAKRGALGAFCRAYGIKDAIEKYLPETYADCGIEGRYTYATGSTAAGLVTYDDKFAYSHHGTDPISGRLCNAFDLVRVHKFAHLDEDADPKTPVNRLKSYAEMIDFVSNDKSVAYDHLVSARAEFADDFEEMGVESEEGAAVSDEWLKELDVDKRLNPLPTIENVRIIMENDPGIKGCFSWDEFERREVLLRDTPWRKIKDGGRYFTNLDLAGVRHFIEKYHGITGQQKIQDALDLVMRRNKTHPLREYLSATQWDCGRRLDSLFIDFLGCPDTRYVRTVTRKTLVAAVKRVFEPGCKHDNVLVIQGRQGEGKSSILKNLGGEWFSDSFSFGLLRKEERAVEQIQGAWLIEVPELSGLRHSEVEAVKHFTSKQDDRVRPAYGRVTETYPRQCIFIGTTNEDDFLKDPTGDRRFWPMATDPLRATLSPKHGGDLTAAYAAQVWAEAVQAYKSGEATYLTSEEEAEAKTQQRLFSETDSREGLILDYLDKKLPEEWAKMDIFARRSYLENYGDEMQPDPTHARDFVATLEVWCEVFAGEAKDFSRKNAVVINSMLSKLEKWEKKQTPRKVDLYGSQRGFSRLFSDDYNPTTNGRLCSKSKGVPEYAETTK